jgi:hypothetical protein
MPWGEVEAEVKAIAQKGATSVLENQEFIAASVETWVNNITEACINELQGLNTEKGQFKFVGAHLITCVLSATSSLTIVLSY